MNIKKINKAQQSVAFMQLEVQISESSITQHYLCFCQIFWGLSRSTSCGEGGVVVQEHDGGDAVGSRQGPPAAASLRSVSTPHTMRIL